jgi:hypothetical protein
MSGPAPDPTDPAVVAHDVRNDLNVIANDLDVLGELAGYVPGCDAALNRLRRQVAQLDRLADRLDPRSE